MRGYNNRPNRSRRRRACTTRCARSKPVPRSGRRWMARDRRIERRRRLGLLPQRPWPGRRRAQAVRPRRHRRPCRLRPVPVLLRSRRAMRAATRTRGTQPHRRHTTTNRSFSTRSCRPSHAYALRFSIAARPRSTTPRGTRRQISAAKPMRRRVTRTPLQLPRRQSTPRSILHRGKTPSATRLAASMRRMSDRWVCRCPK